MIMEGFKSYYAIIPANVRYDDGLPPNAKLLYGEITALCNEKGYCWASNTYFAELYKVTNRTVTSWITDLEEKGYIKREVIYNVKTKVVEERRIYIAETNFNRPAAPKEKTEKETPVKKPKENLKQLEENFLKLWNLYPNKKGKAAALKAYKKAVKNGITNKQIQDGIVKYKNYLLREDWQSPAHGSSWFTQERWSDDYDVSAGSDPVSKKYKSVDDVMKGIDD